jgi:uncharacterized tellurite resistance protein B-like protein
MSLGTKFQALLERIAGDQSRAEYLREQELRLAAAALLVHGAVIDGKFDPDERRKLEAILQTQFDLSGEDTRALLGEAEAREHEAVDLYGFTSVLCRDLDQDGRKRIVEMLWEVVMADAVVHEFEANLVWRAAELLGVSTRDRVLLRKAVASRSGLRSV